MQLGAVALVLAETILRKTGAEVPHNRVARHLRDHARGRDAEAVAIAIDDRRLRQRERKNRQSIDEDMLGLPRQRFQRGAHRLMGGTEDIDRVDLDGIDHADRPENGVVRGKFLVNLLALLRQKLLGIVQPPMLEFLWQNNRGGYDRTGQGAAAGFIDPGDRGDTESAKFAFMPEATAAIHGGKILKS